MAKKSNKDIEKNLENSVEANETEKTASEETVTDNNSVEEQLRQELETTKDSLLRLAAEYDNFKKRSDREREQLTAFVKADTVKKLLPVVDNITFASKSDSASADYTKGLEMIVKQLKEVLEKMGLCEIDSIGQQFDPTVHEAVMHIDDENYGENEVTEVLQAGYKLGDTVLRPAMVKVAN